ncbi:hypothetical protein BJV82DRAFT_607298 [Fennellomyces sp. T-0311]|nr:hypothetical protein BJV82DRAFT_607298 [Fennellomyces sp. T-0311]
MWETVDGGSVGPNFYFAMAALPELDGIFIDGGRGSRVGRGTGAGRHVVGDITEHITSVYNASGQGSWSSVNSSRERVEAHVALTGRNNTVYIYGGRSSDTYTGSTTGGTSFPERLTTFNYLGTPQWNQPSDQLRALTSQRRIHHKGAFGPDQQIIYYIGGIYESRTERMGGLTYTGAPMKEILSYDTSSGSWRNVTATGVTPNYRMDHTVTLDPSTRAFIIYGGATMDTGSPLDDYLYTLDAMTWEYKRITPVSSAEAPGAGPRYGHAAVLVNNSSLFIIFGTNGTAQNSLHVLDIRNNFTWKPSNDAPVSLPSDGSLDKRPGNGLPTGVQSDLKGGDIAGIVVGSLAGVAIIAGAIIFFRNRKRRSAIAMTREMREDVDPFKPESPRVPNGT